MTTLLNGREKDLLREVLQQHARGREDLDAGLDAGTFTREQRSELCRLISSELARTGLGPDDEPNARGLALEALLDTVNRPNLKP